MSCKNCGTNDVISILSHCSDRFHAENQDGDEYEGYVPDDLGIGGGDDVEFDYCLFCGQIQGEFPVNTKCFEKDNEEE
mgnify:CR=1 FL=1